MESTTWLTNGRDKRKCPAHNFWMRKGQCELCRVEADKRHAEKMKKQEEAGGSHKPPIKIGILP